MILAWIATVLSLYGLWLNGRQIVWCWPIWLTSNLCWILSHWGDWPIVVVNAIFFVLNVIGWRNWSRARRR